MTLVCIVEGHGELRAAPVLIRRIAPGLVVKPRRVTKDRFLLPGELEREVAIAGELAGEGGAILILLDADKDCPARLGPAALARARAARADRRIIVALARTEFESWFLAAAKSLRGKRGLPSNLAAPNDPENIRGAKEWIKERAGGRYSPTVDQAAFAALFDLDEARAASPSFRRFERRVLELATTHPRESWEVY